MKNGLKPIKRDTRDRSFHRTFGGITPIALPQEFSVDAGLTMPDQTADGLYEGCTAYTQQELKTDLDAVLSNHYKEHYEKTLLLEGAPFGSGCDIRDSLKILIDFYGVGAYYAVESSKMDWFDSICSVMYTNFVQNKIKCSASIGTPWFKEWDVDSVNSTGVIPTVFTGDPSTLSWHNWKIAGWKTINNVPYLVAKTWQGTGYGNAGWSYYPREAINAVMKINGTGGYVIAPRDATNIQTVKLTMLESLLKFLQQLFTLKQMQPTPGSTQPPQLIYDKAMTLKGQYLTLDTTVPKAFNCAETISYVLKQCGYAMPATGIPGTIALNQWLATNAQILTSADATVGDIIISITQGDNHGHVGILGHQAILSNDSQTGTLESYWSLPAWIEFYQKQKGLVTNYYRLRPVTT